MPIKKRWVSWEELEKIMGGDWTPSPHSHIKADISDLPWSWADVLKAGSNLTDLATRQHAGLTDILADQHHPQSHTLASHSTKPHSALTDVSANQHHAQSHTLASHSTKPHSALTGITDNQHHNKLHGPSHHLGGGDAIKLDDLAEPDEENIDLDVSISRHGLFPILSGHEAECYAGDGAWLRLYDSTSIIIKVLSKASTTTRNSNNAERNTTSSTYVKLKETKLGEPTGVMKIYFELKISTVAAEATARIYKNGVAIGTERSTNSTTYISYTEDLGGFNSQDLIQIYVYRLATGFASVRNLRFQYDRTINMLGECTLENPLIIKEASQTPFSMQNQDP